MRNMHRAVCLAVAALLVVSGAAWAEPVEINFLSFFFTKDVELGNAIIKDFEASHPNIKVNVETMSYNAVAEQTLVRTAAGNPPDVIDLHPKHFYAFAKQGVLEDLTQMAERDLDLEDFFPPVLDTVRVDGRLFAIPKRISTYVLFYNKNLFDADGLAYPSADWQDADWNWDSFYAASKKLRKDTDGDGSADEFGTAIDTGVQRKFLTFLMQSGATLFDDDYSEFKLTEPEAMRAIDFVREGLQDDVFTEGGGTFTDGTTGMIVDIPPSMIKFADNASFDFGVAALPQGPEGPATTLQPIPVGIVSKSKHKKEAWEFLSYYMSRANSIRHSKAGIVVQPRRSVTGDPANYPQIGITDMRPFLGALSVGRPVPNHHLKFPEIADMINDALGPVWEGTADPKAALESIKGPVEELLSANE